MRCHDFAVPTGVGSLAQEDGLRRELGSDRFNALRPEQRQPRQDALKQLREEASGLTAATLAARVDDCFPDSSATKAEPTPRVSAHRQLASAVRDRGPRGGERTGHFCSVSDSSPIDVQLTVSAPSRSLSH